MMSQETIDFVEDIVKIILSRWDTIPLDMKDKMRDELMSVFISFVGSFKQDKRVIGIHLC